MNITLLTNRDIASSYALLLLAPKLRQHRLRVFHSDKTSRPKPQPQHLIDLAIFEKDQLAKLNESSRTKLSSLGSECLNDINTSDFIRFEQSQPDLVISIRHMSILQAKTIKLAKHGVINLHSGLLPQYQGVMATFWAMQNGESRIGTSLHYIDDNTIDTGKIIFQSQTKTNFEKSYFWNVLNLYQDGCENILRAVNLIADSSTIKAQEQLGKARYFSYPTEQDLNEFGRALFQRNDVTDFLS